MREKVSSLVSAADEASIFHHPPQRGLSCPATPLPDNNKVQPSAGLLFRHSFPGEL